MIKKILSLVFLITFLFSTLTLFIPVLYIRYEIKNYLNRYLTEAVIQSDLEIKKNITAYLQALETKLEIVNLEVAHGEALTLSLTYQQPACLIFLPKQPCLFPVRASLIQTKEISK